MGVHCVEKKQLSAKGMLAKIRSIFAQIPETQRDTRGLKSKIPYRKFKKSLAWFNLLAIFF